MPEASAALRSFEAGARLNARSRNSAFICIISKMPFRPLYPLGAASQGTALYTVPIASSLLRVIRLRDLGSISSGLASVFDGSYSTRIRRWAMTAWIDDATKNGLMPMSIKRVIALGASLVWSVENTR